MTMNSRRSFIKNSSILTAGLMMQPSNLFDNKEHKVGLQLYTLRDDVGKDVKGVIGKIAAAGYKQLELFGLGGDDKFFGLSVKDFAALLKENGLQSPSGHYAPEKMLFENGNGDDVKRFCDVGHVMGHEYITVPYLKEENRKTIDQYKTLADRLNKAGEICKAAGLQLAYHNHDFEFQKLEGGQMGYDILLNDTSKDLLKMELDLYWVVRAGYDPAEWFNKQPGRFHMWHVKDMDKADQTKNTEVGNGSIDFKKIFTQAKLSGVKYYFVEQENNYVPDTTGSITTSCKYIKENLFKK